MSEVDGGTCWKCGTKAQRIVELEANLEQAVAHGNQGWEHANHHALEYRKLREAAQALIDDGGAVSSHAHAVKSEVFEALAEVLNAD